MKGANGPSRPRISLRQFFNYFAVGTFVGIITIALREGIGAVLPADTPFYYSVSIVIVYTFGTVLSFLMQRATTFRHTTSAGTGPRRQHLTQLARFTTVALIGAVAAWLLALALRYGIPLDSLVGPLAPSIAFGAAAVTTSFLTYSLNALIVFSDRPPSSMASNST